MKHLSTTEIAEMSIDDRLQLLEDVWDSLAGSSEEIAVPDWHKHELNERLREYNKNPHASSSWADVKERILKNT